MVAVPSIKFENPPFISLSVLHEKSFSQIFFVYGYKYKTFLYFLRCDKTYTV